MCIHRMHTEKQRLSNWTVQVRVVFLIYLSQRHKIMSFLIFKFSSFDRSQRTNQDKWLVVNLWKISRIPHLFARRIDRQLGKYRKFSLNLKRQLFVILFLFTLQNESDGFSKPTYFQVLTCTMFLAFVREKVDVAIVEVGIGGQYDYTNIIRQIVIIGKIEKICFYFLF